MSHDPIWDVIRSTITPGSVSNEVGSITLNSDGTISVTGSYTSDLNSDQTAAINGGGFTKVFAGGYGMYAAQRSNGSLLVLGYATNDSEEQSTVQQLLSSNISDVRFNYAAGAAKTTDGSIITWGHDGYENQVHNLFGEYVINVRGPGEEGEQLNPFFNITNVASGSTFYYSISGTGITSSDYSYGSLNGSIQGGFTEIFMNVADDQTTEGTETYNVKLFSDSALTRQIGTTYIGTIKDTSKTPSYTISPSTTSINEGETLTTSISTTNVAADTTLYWSLSGTGITSSDFSSGALTGSGTVDSNGDFSFSHALANDSATEGNEALNIKLFSDSDRTTQVGTTSVVTITDTSKTPSYSITPSVTTINEGETLTTNISSYMGVGSPADTTLYWSLSGTGITNADFSSGSLTGSGILNYLNSSDDDGIRIFSFAHTLANDVTTEGNENLNIKLFSDSARFTQVGTTTVVTITDTSKTPSYTISPSSTSINEGETLTTSISTTNVAANTTLYYSLSGTGITSADFSSGALTGSGTVDSNGNFSFAHTLANDLLNEGDETLEIKLFSDSGRSTQVGTTQSVTIAGGSTIYALSVDSPSVVEADTNTNTLTYTLTLDQEATGNTNINYETLITGTATSGEDFVKTAGVVTFLEGQSVATLNITVNGDVLLEEDETVKVKFSSTKLKEEVIATGTITNNDKAASTYKASLDSPSITETDTGTKTLAYTISLDQEATETTTINYQTLTTGSATTGEDFVTAAGVVTFTKGQKVATLNISVNGDADVESDETIQVKFSGAALSSEVIATGTIKNNDIAGTDSNDTLNGTTDNDNLKGGGGADVIDGGAGTDTATYTGKFNDYTITKTTTTIQITDIRVTSPDGVDTVQNIEYVQFTDQLVASDKVNVVKTFTGNFRDYKFYNKGNDNYEIKDSSGIKDDITGIPKLTFDDKTADKSVSAIADIKGVFDQVTGKETPSGEMFRLYNAAFARFPDASGLEYWIDKFSSGVDDERAVASSFLVSDEFKERYGDNVSNAKYVETLYVNVLGRDYDQEGYNYWLGNLNAGIETRYELLLGFAESAENKTLFTEMTGFG
ncbi:DUF4214 domain-containing protein [Prochlorococcus sp. MIT 1011]|uniref:DUF4214 domain-containing protein n=1 Tax=Prochlorococcus sp. MIT 1011 TaxID=3082520 RepID=UPI0039B56EDF